MAKYEHEVSVSDSTLIDNAGDVHIEKGVHAPGSIVPCPGSAPPSGNLPYAEEPYVVKGAKPAVPATQEPKWPESDTKPDRLARLRQLKKRDWRKQPIALKYKRAICRQFKYGLNNAEIAGELGVAVETYSHKRNSDEGKALIKALEDFRGDDVRIVEAAMRDEALNSYENLIEARDRLYEAGDYDAAAKIDLKILQAIGFWEKQKVDVNVEGGQVVINLGQQTRDDFLYSEADEVQTDWEVISDDTS